MLEYSVIVFLDSDGPVAAIIIGILLLAIPKIIISILLLASWLSPSSAKKRESSEAQKIFLPYRENLTMDNDSSTSLVPTNDKVFGASFEKAKTTEGK